MKSTLLKMILFQTLALLVIASATILASNPSKGVDDKSKIGGQDKQAASAAAKPLDLPVVAPVIDCSALASADLAQAVGAPIKIVSAKVVDEGKPAAYCDVQVVIDDYGRSEVRLPVSNWQQRFLGGQPGSGQSSGFATMSRQDIGNRGNEDAFANNAQLRVDFAYRMAHLQVLASKALITKYYNQAPKFSYYNACSEPGREGLMEVQRFPEDFDGAATGCPPINNVINNGLFQAWNIRTNTRGDGSLIIASDKLPLIHKAVLDECDSHDGLKDGIVSDPLGCHPKLAAVECKPGQDPSSCLTAEQIHVALELYRGAHDEKGGKLEAFGVLPGSEMQWTAVIAPPPPQPGRSMMFNDRLGTLYALRSEFSYPALGTNWQLSELKFDRADFDNFTKLHYLYDATDPDLSAYYKAGHKLIIWQGLVDNNVLPAHLYLYYHALQRTLGEKTVEKFVRFYVLPGVGHCGGGGGPAIRDFLAPLQLWVERGIAPGALTGSHVPQPARGMGGPGGPGGMGPGGPGGMMGEGPQQGGAQAKPDLTRPIYPYPYTAKYIGTGDPKDTANFVQGPARPAPAEIFNWWGANFYTPHYEKWCTGDGATLNCKDSR